MNRIKWLIAQYRIISLKKMEKKIEESETKNFVYYENKVYILNIINFITLFIFKIYEQNPLLMNLDLLKLITLYKIITQIIAVSTILIFLTSTLSLIYSYEDNIWYIIRSTLKQQREFINKFQDLEKNKPINSECECRIIDDSKLNRLSFLILQIISYIKTYIESVIYFIFSPFRIPFYIISFIKYLRS